MNLRWTWNNKILTAFFLIALLILTLIMPLSAVCAVPSGDLEKIIAEETERRSKRNFLGLYSALWQASSMAQKLDSAVDAAFDEQIEELSLGGVDLTLNSDNVIEHIQEAVESKFAADYDAFLRLLENRWNIMLLGNIAVFCSEHPDLAADSELDFTARVWLREDSEAGENHDLLQLTSGDSENKITDTLLSGAVNEVLSEAAWSIPVLNLFIMARTAWKTASKLSVIMKAEKVIRDRLHSVYQNYYAEVQPGRIWHAIIPAVKDAYVSACAGKGQLAVLERMLAVNPNTASLCEGLPDEQKREFIRRAAVALYKLNSRDADSLLRDFGTMIRDAVPFNYARLAEILRENGLERTKAWFDLAGEQFYDLYTEFPQDVWGRFLPAPETLEVFQWMAQNLTKRGRAAACALSADDLNWVMDSLPPRYVPRLLNGKHTPSAVHREIMRLAKFPEDDRVPWRGALVHLWLRYGFYAVLAVAAAVAGLFLIRFLLQKLRVQRRRISTKLKTLQETAQLPAFAGVTVKLQIRRDAADELGLSRMMWNQSQCAELSADGLSVIFTACVEHAEAIVRWCACNAGKTQIIEPEELRDAKLSDATPARRTAPSSIRVSTNVLPPSGTIELGLVYGACCQENYAGNITAAVQNATSGGELAAYTGLMTDGMKTARDRMVKMARKMNADGIYGVQTVTPQVANNAAEFVVFGTAYRFIFRPE
jgi:uncharacterized protein YbjQ (UPF0145 family)